MPRGGRWPGAAGPPGQRRGVADPRVLRGPSPGGSLAPRLPAAPASRPPDGRLPRPGRLPAAREARLPHRRHDPRPGLVPVPRDRPAEVQPLHAPHDAARRAVRGPDHRRVRGHEGRSRGDPPRAPVQDRRDPRGGRAGVRPAPVPRGGRRRGPPLRAPAPLLPLRREPRAAQEPAGVDRGVRGGAAAARRRGPLGAARPRRDAGLAPCRDLSRRRGARPRRRRRVHRLRADRGPAGALCGRDVLRLSVPLRRLRAAGAGGDGRGRAGGRGPRGLDPRGGGRRGPPGRRPRAGRARDGDRGRAHRRGAPGAPDRARARARGAVRVEHGRPPDAGGVRRRVRPATTIHR